MKSNNKFILNIVAFCGLFFAGLAQAQPPTGPMSFFVTSQGSGNGGDLGGLAGADEICQNLAESVDQGHLTWRAYLSTQGDNAVNARDRIGPGPWFNANGYRVGADLESLHNLMHRIGAETGLDERARVIPGSFAVPNRHDILTGSTSDGRAYPPGEDMTCNNWTSSSDDGKARVGHHDFAGWASSHNSRGCSQDALISSGGDGLLYCFAVRQ
ncbi:MAG: hypothetical protein V3R24_07070 [Gemmatimonadales bacterium]